MDTIFGIVDAMDTIFGIFFAALAVICLGMFVLIGWCIYDGLTAETFDLRKDSWACTASHTETQTSFVQVGNVMVPTSSTSTICDQWSRR